MWECKLACVERGSDLNEPECPWRNVKCSAQFTDRGLGQLLSFFCTVNLETVNISVSTGFPSSECDEYVTSVPPTVFLLAKCAFVNKPESAYILQSPKM